MPDIVLQDSPDEGGSTAYSGKGRVGKTTEAVSDCNQDSRKTGFPKGVLDLGSVMSFRHLEHSKNVDEFLTDLFIRRVDAKPWTPESKEARRKLWTIAHKWGGVHLLCDEIWNMCSADYVDPELVTLSNQYAHGPNGPVYLYFIGQRTMFINQNLFASIKKWKIFQSSDGAEQKTLRAMFGEKVNGNQFWPRGKFEIFDRSARPPEETETDSGDAAEAGKGGSVPGKLPDAASGPDCPGGHDGSAGSSQPERPPPGAGPHVDQSK